MVPRAPGQQFIDLLIFRYMSKDYSYKVTVRLQSDPRHIFRNMEGCRHYHLPGIDTHPELPIADFHPPFSCQFIPVRDSV